ncbi:cleft lip and palate transmembrane 1 [Scenedesmus sp. NREL 46B-D3]|nr:cleft lip and palate transmembrane 1 [Scenedesmus sp. NREL 46B-D3]
MLDMYVYVSEQSYLQRERAELVWSQTDVGLATTPERTATYTYTPSQAVKKNGTLYAHVVFARSGVNIDAQGDDLPPDSIFSKSHSLVVFMPRRQNKTGTNLLSEGGNFTTQKRVEPVQREWISYYKPNLTVALVDHFQAYPKNAIPPQVSPHLLLNGEGQQYPIFYFDEFWLLRDKLLPVNDTLDTVPLHITVKTQKFWWMQIQQQMEQSFQMQINTGLAQDGEADEVKRIFLEGNPYLLALTMAVSMLHSVFDFLAFKNDIGFWRENKSMEGLSARSIVINAFCQAVIFLYLLDNETSMVVLFSAGIGTLIEFWKVTKAMDVSVKDSFPFLVIKDRASYNASHTKQHDATAMRYLSYVLYPLVFGYSIYALVYETHKSWYSWVLNSLVGAVYAFGFILMCPQLYLNYKLQSVAHLPWRQMTYKFLNTIIDDLFAFVIKMPTLHRLSVFRDDLIFLIYLYQRWIYRVDMTRVNEFGFSGQQASEVEAAKEAAEAANAAAATDGVPALEASQVEEPAGAARRRKGAGRSPAAAAAGGADDAASAANGEAAEGSKKGQ